MTHLKSTTSLLATLLVGSIAGVVVATSTSLPPPSLLHQASYRVGEKSQPFLPWWEAAVATNQLSEARGAAGPVAGKLLEIGDLPKGPAADNHTSGRRVKRQDEVVLRTPTDLRVTAVGRDFINLEWQYDGGERGLVFLVNVYYEGGKFAKDQEAHGRSLRVDGLAPGTAYQLSVKVFKPLPNGRRAYSQDSSRVSATTQVTSATQPPRPSPRPPVTTAPPTTQGTTLPPSPRPEITDTITPPGLGCGEGQCACPPPHNLVCVPCARLSTCQQINVEVVCSTKPASKNVKMSVNILSCGRQPILNVVGIIRNNGGVQCGSSAGVPAQTVAIVECWNSATLLVQCHADGSWHPYGQHQTHAPSTRNLCQFDTINSPVCGRRPVQQKPSGLLSVRLEPKWPWLAGLFRLGSFICTATVITPDYLLTAAHCLTSTQETSMETLDPRELRVQHLDSKGLVVQEFVSRVFAYPGFVAGSRPSHDVALLRLEKPIVFSYHVYPACLHTQGLPAHTIAATFNRTSNQFKWQLFLQRHEPLCHSPHDPCATSINLQDDQFCAVQAEFEGSLDEGSSGGPYLVNEGSQAEERWVVAGLVSSSYRRAACHKPVIICTTVADFWPWISRCVHEANCS